MICNYNSIRNAHIHAFRKRIYHHGNNHQNNNRRLGMKSFFQPPPLAATTKVDGLFSQMSRARLVEWKRMHRLNMNSSRDKHRNTRPVSYNNLKATLTNLGGIGMRGKSNFSSKTTTR